MKTTDMIRQLCKQEQISVTILEERLGFSNGSLTKNRVIRSDRLYKVAQYFNVTMDYLMTGKMEIPANSPFAKMQTDKIFMDNIIILWGLPKKNREAVYKAIRHEKRDWEEEKEKEEAVSV